MLKSRKWNSLFFDGSDQDSIARGFLDGNYTDGRIFPTSSVFAELKKGNEDKITYTPQNSVTFLIRLFHSLLVALTIHVER